MIEGNCICVHLGWKGIGLRWSQHDSYIFKDETTLLSQHFNFFQDGLIGLSICILDYTQKPQDCFLPINRPRGQGGYE